MRLGEDPCGAGRAQDMNDELSTPWLPPWEEGWGAAGGGGGGGKACGCPGYMELISWRSTSFWCSDSEKKHQKKHRRGCETSVRTMPVSPLSLSVHPAVCLSLCSHFSQVSSPLSAQHTHTEKRQRQTDRKRDRRKKELFFWEWERGCCNLTVPFVNSSMEQPG